MTDKNKKVQTVVAPTKKEPAKPIMSLAQCDTLFKKLNITTVSGKIRYLASEGHSRSAIALTLNKRYQHVRNVLVENVQTNK